MSTVTHRLPLAGGDTLYARADGLLAIELLLDRRRPFNEHGLREVTALVLARLDERAALADDDGEWTTGVVAPGTWSSVASRSTGSRSSRSGWPGSPPSRPPQ